MSLFGQRDPALDLPDLAAHVEPLPPEHPITSSVSKLRTLIPSMYQRRLLLVSLAMAAGGVLPVLQMARLTLARGEELRADAEKRLVSESWLETVRGRIVDAKGRVLAMDRASFDIAVDYSVITGEWVQDAARDRARRAAGYRWSQMSREDRRKAADEQVPQLEAHLREGWKAFCSVAGVSLEEVQGRTAEIRQQVEYLATRYKERERARIQEKARAQGRDVEVLSAEVRTQIAEETSAHVILRNVPDKVGFALDTLRGELGAPGGGTSRALPVMPGLRVHDSMRREYPLSEMDVPVDLSSFPVPLRREGSEDKTVSVRVGGVGMHVIGWMRPRIEREDLDRRPRLRPDGTVDPGHYRTGDAVGQGGVELAQEDALRGLRGVETKHLDTGEIDRTPATPGGDVRLTIDAMLQARVQALFDPSLGLAVVQPWQKPKREGDEPPPVKELPPGTPLNGAVVVIDVATGKVLSMVSVPSFTHEQLEGDAKAIRSDDYNLAYTDRTVARIYTPGSVVKPLVMCAAAAAGRLDLSERIRCTGHFFADKPLLYRCWIYKLTKGQQTHSGQLGHDLTAAEAIGVSCNIFFFEMGRRLGTGGIHDLYTSLGVGADATAFNLYGLPALPSEPEARKAELNRRRFAIETRGSVFDPEKAELNEAILMGIGQGPVAWTPMHAAAAYAALARGGEMAFPRLYDDAPPAAVSLGFPRRAVDEALRGLRMSANEDHGTTYTITYDLPDGRRIKERVFNARGIDIWAKSGTADTNPFRADLDLSGGKEEYDGDHAWCVLLAGVDGKPKYSIAVVVDHGGSGGRVAGPIANQVVHALIAEGYLPDHAGNSARGSEGGR